MFNTDEMIKRFCTSINWEAKQLEKKDLQDKIDDFPRKDNFTVKLENESENNTLINDILEEYKDAGYRCTLCNSSSDDTVLPEISIQFQIFVRVNKIPNVIPALPVDKYGYTLPSECEIVKI